MGAGTPLALCPEVQAKVDTASRLPQSETKVALQIVPVQLRAWVVDQSDVVCRPYYIACLELYPRGKVLNARMHQPASERPDASALASFLVEHMTDPPTGERRQRPTHVSFIEDAVVESCAPLLRRLQITGGMLTLADGVTDYVKMFSEKLVKLGRASRGDSAEQPGLLTVDGITPDSANAFMTEAVSMYRAAPWNGLSESIALEATLPAPRGRRSRKVRYYVSVLGSSGNVFGFAVMASLDSLRAKYRRSREGAQAAAASQNGSSNEGTHTLGELLCARCGSRVGEDAEPDGCRYVYRCGSCKRLLYCDDNCQQLDWGARHRNECRQALADKDFVFHREEWAWLRRELALLFVDPTSVPFDDLDAGAEHKWPFIDSEDPPLHPTAFVTIEGTGGAATRKVDRPTADELCVLSMLATALSECSAPPPGGGEVMLPNGVVLRVAEDLAKAR